MTHTPTPYEFHEMDNGCAYQITASVGGSLRTVAIVAAPHGGAGIKTKTPKAKANAEFIVRACNAHDELVEALEAYVNPDVKLPAGKRGEMALAALTKARGEA